MFTLTRRQAPPAGNGTLGVALDQSDSRWPALLVMLCSDRYPDGSVRQTSTLTLFYDACYLKASLNDRDAGMTAWASADSLEGLLDTLERGLQEDGLDWRSQRPRRPKGK